MRRYRGEDLGLLPRIAVVSNDAIGNFVVGTPLMQMLRARFLPQSLDYFGGNRTTELSESSDLIDRAYALHGTDPHVALPEIAEWAGSGYDLVFNTEWTAFAQVSASVLAGEHGFVCGPCLGPGGRAPLPFPEDRRGDLWRDQSWIREGIEKEYEFLDSPFIGEFFCRLAYMSGDVPRYRLPVANPGMDVPDILIATAASLDDKLWTEEGWTEMIERFGAQGKTVGLLGAPPRQQKEHWKGGDLERNLLANTGLIDLRGKFSLPGVVGALAQCSGVLTLDNGILHLAAATETPVIGLFREGIHRLWTPPAPNIHAIVAEPGKFVREIGSDRVAEISASVYN